jgi:hypothetical protein
MMEFKRVEVIEIDENEVAEDLEGALEEILEYYDRKFAQEMSKKDKLEILNRVGKIWHDKYVQYMTDYIKGVLKEECEANA